MYLKAALVEIYPKRARTMPGGEFLGRKRSNHD
jgi:hypothetical protein